MKTLFLIRHAKSSWADTLQQDFDRPLNDRGNRDAPMMALLKELLRHVNTLSQHLVGKKRKLFKNRSYIMHL
jgi:phosphohistidine phosphatase